PCGPAEIREKEGRATFVLVANPSLRWGKPSGGGNRLADAFSSFHFSIFNPTSTMSTLTLRKTWNVDGIPTDPTSIVLRDPTAAYGVKRDDTGAIVVAAGAAMTHVATGVYEYTVDVADPGTTYTAWIEVVYAGETFRFE